MASSPLCPDLPLPFVVAALSRRSSRRAASGRRLSWLSGPGLGPSARTGYGRSHPLPYSTQPHPLLCSALLSSPLLSSPSPLFSSRPLTVSSPSRHRPLSSPLRLPFRLLSSPLLSAHRHRLAALTFVRSPTHQLSTECKCHIRLCSPACAPHAGRRVVLVPGVEDRFECAHDEPGDRGQASVSRTRSHEAQGQGSASTQGTAAQAQGQGSGSTKTGQREHRDRAAGAQRQGSGSTQGQGSGSTRTNMHCQLPVPAITPSR